MPTIQPLFFDVNHPSDSRPLAVIFDLDGVITDTAEFHYLAWKNLASQLNITIDRPFNETLKGISRTDSLKAILAHGGVLADYSDADIHRLADQKNAAYVTLIQGLTPADILPGIETLLKGLQVRGVKIAMASASKNALMVSKLLHIESYFDHIVDAATVGQSKPNPEVFLRAAQAVGVPPERCVGVEDAHAGVAAVKAAGMYAIGIGEPTILNNADVIFASTASLPELLSSTV